MTTATHIDFKAHLLERVDVVELIQQRIPLKKEGHHFVARCPFHEEKTASFKVSSEKQFYYCFGCGAHGNAIDFLIAYDRMEFKEALAYLSQLTGVAPPNQSQKKNLKYQPLYDLMKKVSHFYQNALEKSPTACEYLKKRGLDADTIKQFVIGYAPNDWHNLQRSLGDNPTLIHSLVQCGMLVQKNTDHDYDRFRHRIMFPIRNVRGEIVAFGGRSIDGSEPKYLNSPETEIFHKSYELYGLYEAKQQKREIKQLLVVEGYMDVIALHQFNCKETVATLGTAFNRHHALKLFRYCNNIVFCFDGDNAGRNAAWKALTVCLPLLNDGVQVKFLFLPSNEDPDSLIRQIGYSAFQEKMQQATPLSTFFFTKLAAECPINNIAEKATYAKKAITLLDTMPNGVMRQLMLEELAKRLGLLKNDLGNLTQHKYETDKPDKVTVSQIKKPRGRVENKLLNPMQRAICLLLHQPQLKELVAEPDLLTDSAANPETELFLCLLELFKNEPHISTGQLLGMLQSEDHQRIVAKLSAKELHIPIEGFAAEFRDCLLQLKKNRIQLMINRLIAQAKQGQLTVEEQRCLQQLLQNKG